MWGSKRGHSEAIAKLSDEDATPFLVEELMTFCVWQVGSGEVIIVKGRGSGRIAKPLGSLLCERRSGGICLQLGPAKTQTKLEVVVVKRRRASGLLIFWGLKGVYLLFGLSSFKGQ